MLDEAESFACRGCLTVLALEQFAALAREALEPMPLEAHRVSRGTCQQQGFCDGGVATESVLNRARDCEGNLSLGR